MVVFAFVFLLPELSHKTFDPDLVLRRIAFQPKFLDFVISPTVFEP